MADDQENDAGEAEGHEGPETDFEEEVEGGRGRRGGGEESAAASPFRPPWAFRTYNAAGRSAYQNNRAFGGGTIYVS